jgi:hypothetical protein
MRVEASDDDPWRTPPQRFEQFNQSHRRLRHTGGRDGTSHSSQRQVCGHERRRKGVRPEGHRHAIDAKSSAQMFGMPTKAPGRAPTTRRDHLFRDRTRHEAGAKTVGDQVTCFVDPRQLRGACRSVWLSRPRLAERMTRPPDADLPRFELGKLRSLSHHDQTPLRDAAKTCGGADHRLGPDE